MSLPPILLLLLAPFAVLWQRPSVPVTRADFTRAANATRSPEPPFIFLQEDLTGNSPKVLVRDANSQIWQVKGGPEARAEAFITRFLSATGYYADSVWFIPRGKIEGIIGPLRRAHGFITADGSFTYAGFELRDARSRYMPKLEWSWVDNPFRDTRELGALKLLVMLFSNWDNKDSRDRRQGTNTGVMRMETGHTAKDVYYITDWGQSFGSWGTWFGFGRSNWNCADYSHENSQWIGADRKGRLTFGYRGQHTDDFLAGIVRDDVKWLADRISSVTDAQIRIGLRASGASPAEEECFARALRDRIERLKRVTAREVR